MKTSDIWFDLFLEFAEGCWAYQLQPDNEFDCIILKSSVKLTVSYP